LKYIKEHWLIALILLLSSLTSAFFNFQKLRTRIFAQETEFAGQICAEREPFPICDESNTAVVDFFSSSSGTGVIYQVNLTYQLRDGLDDPCKPHRYLLNNFDPSFNVDTNIFTFPFLKGNRLGINENGECADRLYEIVVSDDFVVENESSFDRFETDYNLVGNFLISQKNDIRGITEFHLSPR